MLKLIAFLLSLTITLCLSEEERSHDVFLTKLESGQTNPDWVTNETTKVYRVGRNRKAVDLNFTLVQDITPDNVLCLLKVYQKMGGKYVKAPFDIPQVPCCDLTNDNRFVWRCLRAKTVEAPSECPIPKGEYHLKDFDPYECDIPKFLPPNIPEDYKIEFIGAAGPLQAFKHVGYGKIKKRLQLAAV